MKDMLDATNMNNSLNLIDKLNKGEYEAQFFQTSALSLAYSLKELIKSYVQTSLTKLSLTIEGKAANPNELTKVKEIMEVLRQKYKIAIDEHCKEMEHKIHEIFDIPPHILLPEDSIQIAQYTSDEEKKLNEEIASLKLRYKRATCMKALLNKQRHSIKCIDLMEKATFEIEGNVDTFKNVFEDKEKRLEELDDEVKQFKNLEANLQKLNISQPSSHQLAIEDFSEHEYVI